MKERHENRIMQIEGVEGIGIGELSGKPVIKIYVTKKTRLIQEKIPAELDGYPVSVEVVGEFHAL